MIVPMCKVFVVGLRRDSEPLLAAIAELGMLHLEPADPSRAVADEQTVERIAALRRVLQVLGAVAPRGSPPELPAADAAREVLELQRQNAEHAERLAALHHELEQLGRWGDVRLEQFQQLQAAGIDVRFYSVPANEVAEFRAECVEVVDELPGHASLVAVVGRGGPAELPAGASPVPLPPRDAPSIRREAGEIDAAIKQIHRRLGRLARLVGEVRTELDSLERQAEYTIARRGALGGDDLFAVQGWVPREKSAGLVAALASRGAVVETMEADPDEQPPTLIRSPGWTRPIKGLFDILGMVAGYREFDLSVPFLIALPIFTAILISDGGYGAVLAVGLALGYRRASRLLGGSFTRLLILVGLAALAWGVVCGTFFGVTLYTPLVAVDLREHSRMILMRLCFTCGVLHLSLAHFWPAVRLFPDLRFLNEVGWGVFLWGMLGVVEHLVLQTPLGWHTPWAYLLLIGASLAVVFAQPERNVAKMLLTGLARFPLSMISAFSDVISYVRLMAVGLASSVLAVSFNKVAGGIGFWPLAILVLLFGHGLNIGLSMIAMFAHGVRLNILEFSNNLGMQWTGYPYRPFLGHNAVEA
jgi:V/A-type H+-transporting ATPase subunit I